MTNRAQLAAQRSLPNDPHAHRFPIHVHAHVAAHGWSCTCSKVSCNRPVKLPSFMTGVGFGARRRSPADDEGIGVSQAAASCGTARRHGTEARRRERRGSAVRHGHARAEASVHRARERAGFVIHTHRADSSRPSCSQVSPSKFSARGRERFQHQSAGQARPRVEDAHSDGRQGSATGEGTRCAPKAPRTGARSGRATARSTIGHRVQSGG